MKKLLALICASLLALAASAQANKGEVAAGVNLLYGTEIKSMGLGARFNYAIIDQLRGQVELDFFFKHNHTKWCDISINADYLLPLRNEKLYVYPKAGLTYSIVSFEDGNVDSNHLGLNLGAGIEYDLTDHLAATFEYRHTIMRKVDQGTFALGINYKF